MNLKETKGITLIALVITIIILLILASVSIAMLTGENGLLTKASDAKNETEIAGIKENVKLDLLAKMIDGDTLSKHEFKNILKKYFDNVPATIPDDLTTLTLTAKESYGKHSIKISDIWNQKLEETIITAKVVKESPEDYYGKKVNYTAPNGHSDWKIFYSNGNNIFLIASDVVENTKIDKDKTKMKTEGIYKAWWIDGQKQTVSNEVETLFMASGYSVINNSYDQAKNCISTLLNTNNWTNFTDNSKAKYTIGGPTIEMWVDSWNDVYPNEKIILNYNNEGYKIGTDANKLSTYININQMQGSKNKLYFSDDLGSSEGCIGYWFSSDDFSAYSILTAMYPPNYDRILVPADTGISSRCYGVRPVVALREGMSVEIVE